MAKPTARSLGIGQAQLLKEWEEEDSKIDIFAPPSNRVIEIRQKSKIAIWISGLLIAITLTTIKIIIKKAKE